MIEECLDDIIEDIGYDATMRVLTSGLKTAEKTSSKEVPQWKKQIELLTKKIEKATKKKIIEKATTVAHINDRISASADTPDPVEPEEECPPWCHNPYCDCRN